MTERNWLELVTEAKRWVDRALVTVLLALGVSLVAGCDWFDAAI